jgi:hypothetical protein
MRSAKALLISTLVFLSACTEIVQPRAPLNLADPEPLSLKPVKWSVVPVEDKNGNTVVLFSLTETGYKNMSLNVQDILNYLILQKRILEEYREYYEPEAQEEVSE